MAAIGTESKQRLGPARNAFPERVDHGVYYCGYAAESSYGARSYLIRWMFLTHRDDVADHAKFRERFGCERILHAADVTRGTAEVERKLKGEETTSLDEEALFIPVPGHTPGSTALLYRDRFLFSGEHAWWDPQRNRVHASKSVCWYDWEKQTASMQRLPAYRFEWLLPGHGTRCRLPEKQMAAEVAAIVKRMKEI